MKRLTFVLFAVVTMFASLFSGATRGDLPKLPLIVRASEGDLDFIQTQGDVTTRISIGANGVQGNGASSSFKRYISSDGRYVVFESIASNLVSGDTNGKSDIFVHDRQTGQTSRVSVASNGGQGNGDSFDGSISADGRYVTFYSVASNLVGGDTNGVSDVFVYDRQTGQTTRISVASGGLQANGLSESPSISGDGRFIAFDSDASNLVSSDTNGAKDIFIHDRQTSQTSRLSVASDSTQGNEASFGPSISADGNYIVFRSIASNLVSNDTNDVSDIFVRDRQMGQTTRVSVTSGGTPGNESSTKQSISADGRYVVFRSQATNLVSNDTNGKIDVFIHDRQTGQTSRLSVKSGGTQGNGDSDDPAISADGRYVAFYSEASNLVSGDTNSKSDIFINDRQTNQITRVSVTSSGTQGNGHSSRPSLSSDGRYVSFQSEASNLVSGDTNSFNDVFIYDSLPSNPEPASRTIFLPMVLKAPSAPLTNLYVKNLTTGIVFYTVHNTPQGNITCGNIPAGATVFCGSFTPGTYNVSVSTTQCGANSGQVTFPPGDVTRPVSC